jgi:hypothetical protein
MEYQGKRLPQSLSYGRLLCSPPNEVFHNVEFLSYYVRRS